MVARALHRGAVLLDQRLDLRHQRRDLGRRGDVHVQAAALPHLGQLLPGAAQRPQPPDHQHHHHGDEAGAEHEEGQDHLLAQPRDLGVQRGARHAHLHRHRHLAHAGGDGDALLQHAQQLVARAAHVARADALLARQGRAQARIPQRARGGDRVRRAAQLPVMAGERALELRVGQGAQQDGAGIGVEGGGGDHGIHDGGQPRIGRGLDLALVGADHVERQQPQPDGHPERGDDGQPPRQRAAGGDALGHDIGAAPGRGADIMTFFMLSNAGRRRRRLGLRRAAGMRAHGRWAASCAALHGAPGAGLTRPPGGSPGRAPSRSAYRPACGAAGPRSPPACWNRGRNPGRRGARSARSWRPGARH